MIIFRDFSSFYRDAAGSPHVRLLQFQSRKRDFASSDTIETQGNHGESGRFQSHFRAFASSDTWENTPDTQLVPVSILFRVFTSFDGHSHIPVSADLTRFNPIFGHFSLPTRKPPEQDRHKAPSIRINLRMHEFGIVPS
jgi:hypothetical protein